jgi:hypothetical protein
MTLSAPPNVAVPRYDDAVALLRTLSGPNGIRASLSEATNYRAVFARDAVMAGVAGLLVGDPAISGGLLRTLDGLRESQGPEGQIASNYESQPGRPPAVSFGTLAPRIDATTWYLIGVALGARAGIIDPAPFRESVRAVIRLLNALEYNGRDLMYIPAGGNWADEYIYDGYILYDQVLRAWALRLLSTTYDESEWRDKATRIGDAIQSRYPPNDDPERRHPPAAFSPVRMHDMFDLAASSLLGVSGVAPGLATTALDWIDARFLGRAELPPAFHPVIDEGHPDWPALRRYHLHEFRNRPNEYHNGGVWPVWLGWLALALARTGRAAALERLRQLVRDRLDALPGFDFDEYLHGKTGVPGGMRKMAYSATGIVFLGVAGTPSAVQLFGE